MHITSFLRPTEAIGNAWPTRRPDRSELQRAAFALAVFGQLDSCWNVTQKSHTTQS